MIPTLPDPYAVGTLPNTLTQFNVGPQQCDPAQPTYIGTALPDNQVVVAAIHWPDVAHPSLAFRLAGSSAELIHECLVLDVSSNADQLGAAAFTQSTSQIGFSTHSGLLLVPGWLWRHFQISWEPMTNGPAEASPQPISPPNDGNAAILYAATQTLVPVEPVLLLNNVFQSAQGVGYLAQFTLPFGIEATANQTTTKRPKDPRPR